MICARDRIETLDFISGDGLHTRARLSLIVLQGHQNIEHELANVFRGQGVAIRRARIPIAMEVTPDTLRQKERYLPRTAELPWYLMRLAARSVAPKGTGRLFSPG